SGEVHRDHKRGQGQPQREAQFVHHDARRLESGG
ncbi:MAG: hypothetical protein ACI9EZ_001621, partial [Halobacteriales archaeon]